MKTQIFNNEINTRKKNSKVFIERERERELVCFYSIFVFQVELHICTKKIKNKLIDKYQ